MPLKSKPTVIIHRKIGWLLLFFLVTLAIVSWLVYRNKRNIEQTVSGIEQSYGMVVRLQELAISTLGAGDLVRGQLAFRQGVDSLEEMEGEQGDQASEVKRLSQFADMRAQLVDGRHAEELAVLDGRIRQHINQMIAEDRKLLSIRTRLNEEADRQTAVSLIILRIATTVFIIIVLIKLNKDITTRMRTQAQLVTAIREAQEAKKMQEQFLANMSHEIRTPMNGIKGMTELLLDTPLSVKQQELTSIIKSSADNLLVIINDILDFSKIKAGKLNIDSIDFQVKQVVEGAAAIFEQRLAEKGVKLRLDMGADIPAELTGDPHRLYQVLVNILGNAVKFTHEGQIDLSVRAEVMEAKEGEAVGKERQVMLFFDISDTGIGIPAESVPHIFDSFSQAGQEITRRYGGTGLGLTICKQLLQLQGGHITVSSEVGKGSDFKFQIPYTCKLVDSAGKPRAPLSYDYSNLLIGRTFLVVEDNEINQKVIDYVLKKAGGEVEVTANGLEAIGVLESGRKFDLIIMDLQMPEMDGYATTRYIREDLRMPTPIIAMTATAMKGEHLQCIEAGMNEYMTKPFEFSELYKRIGVLLS